MKVLGYLILIAATLGGVFLFIGWVQPATMPSDDPYDETFVAINQLLPQPMRDWACDQLAAEFGESAAPPPGCEDVWGPGRP